MGGLCTELKVRQIVNSRPSSLLKLESKMANFAFDQCPRVLGDSGLNESSSKVRINLIVFGDKKAGNIV